MLVALSFYYDIMRLCRNTLILCRDISALANFFAASFADLFLVHSKPAKHKVGDNSIILH